MLVFAAEFPASENATTEQLLDCCRQWIVGSQYYPWSDPSELISEPEHVVDHERDGHRVSFGRVRLSDHCEIAGTQYEWIDKATHRWTTEIVGRREPQGLWVSVQLFCELLTPGLRLPTPRKPYFLKQLMENLGGGRDGEFQVQDRPHILREDQLELAERIVRGQMANALPIVYVSSAFSGTPSVDIEKVSRWMAGLCHVVAEPNRVFSRRLATHVDNVNVYGGAVGVYWPESSGQHFRLIPANFDAAAELESELQRLVRSALTHARSRKSASWNDLREALSKKRIEEVKSRGDATLQEYIAAFDAEQEVLTDQRDAAKQESERLRETVKRLQEAKPGVLELGAEQELYPGEILDVLVKVLSDVHAATPDGSRRKTVLADLVKANKQRETAHPSKIENEIRRVLSNTDRIGSSELEALRKIGFIIEDGGKHYKATFGEDPRLAFTLFKTASDHRAGKNLAADILRTLFK